MINSDPRAFFNFAKKQGVIGNAVGPLKQDNGQLVYDKQSMSNILNDQYNKVFNREVHHPTVVIDSNVCMENVTSNQEISLSNFFSDENAPLSNVTFNEENVSKAIAMIKTSSASGPDKLCPLFLKKD